MIIKRKTTIFKQIVVRVIFPGMIALIILGVFNYFNTKNLIVKSQIEKKEIIAEQIQSILEMQDMSLNILEEQIDTKLEQASNKLVNNYFQNTDILKTINLKPIRKSLDFKANYTDIYIINRKGFVINTTFYKDLNLNYFSFGLSHIEHLLQIFKDKKFVSERFTTESSTGRLKKYTYQPTLDGKYIIEIGSYSKKADKIIKFVNNSLNKLANNRAEIIDVNLFIEGDVLFPINPETKIGDYHKDIINRLLKNKGTEIIKEKVNGVELIYEYRFIERKNTDLYKGSVSGIVYDYSNDKSVITTEIIKTIAIFSIIIVLLLFLIHKNVKEITEPIKRLVSSINQISQGNFDKRTKVEGNNEISILSEHFNIMIGKIQEYYNVLEDKVRERTTEIVKNKEEIERQNKHITESLNYAQKIQNIIIPKDKNIQEYYKNSFIYFKPRDIVSGDFPWIFRKDEFIYIAAVDCTGHGVPGALLSIIGYFGLNNIVDKKDNLHTGEILNKLHSYVRKSLKQNAKDAKSRDGMDLALYKIDTIKQEIEFSGAHQPLYIIRDNKLIELKGDRKAIGGIPIKRKIDKEEKKFTTQKIEYKKLDRLFVFSDGFQDQINNNKEKYKTKNLKKLLLNNNDGNIINLKKTLNNELVNWKQSSNQIDDILFIGLEL